MSLKKKLKKKGKGNLRVKVHDIEAMNKTELKYYILKLRSEMKNLRESMHGHTIGSNRLHSLQKQQQQEGLQRTKYDISNNCDFFNLVAKFKFQLEEAHCKAIVQLQERHRMNAVRLLEEYLGSSILENSPEKNRMKQIQNRRRNVKEEEILSNVAVKGVSACDVDCINLLDKTVFDYSLKFLKHMRLFSSAKQTTLSNIYDLSKPGNCALEGHPANVLRNVEVYFRQLNFDTRRVILDLRQKLAKLEEKQRLISVLLDKAIEENTNLLSKQNKDFEEITEIHCFKYDCVGSIQQKVNFEVEKLVLRREDLKKKLKDLLDKKDSLKKEFLSAVAKFHERGEYRAYVAKETLKVTFFVHNKYSPSNYSENREVTKSNNVSNNRNFQNSCIQRRLELQNSEALYIPHQFQTINKFERVSKWLKTI